MSRTEETLRRLAEISNLQVSEGAPLARYTRFGIGGPADVYAETDSVDAFIAAVRAARSSGIDTVVIGGGTNLIVADSGFRGIVLRFVARNMLAKDDRISVDAGATLQSVVDFSIENGLKGLETMAGIPGSLGAAVYGNAGAYGRSISELVEEVRFYDGDEARAFDNSRCEFRYRESVFKRHKDWVIFSATLRLEPAETAELRRAADEIMAVRDRKFPATMKCAGSVFKNLLARDLPTAVLESIPENVIREGKIPAAYFLEQAGAKGASRGDIRVADYHANLIYNDGAGAASDLRDLIDDLKSRVRRQFGIELEEEVQYLGFDPAPVCAE